MLPDNIRSIIAEGLKTDAYVKEARAILGLPGGGDLEYSVLASLKCYYQTYLNKQERLPYNRTLSICPQEEALGNRCYNSITTI